MSELLHDKGPWNFVIAGAGRFSLGDYVAEQLSLAEPDSTILTIDVAPAPSSRANIVPRCFDLNPFRHASGFEAWAAELRSMVGSVVCTDERRRPIRSVLLGAARYDVGAFEATSASIREDILGTNVVGKFEVLHAVMSLNTDCGFANGEVLSVVDVGSLHTLHHTSDRALYNSSKAAGLELCRVLAGGAEVRMAVHVAPGPIDTPMLHWNHWVLKEKGDPHFVGLIRSRLPSLYGAIFRGGDETALNRVIEELNLDGRAVLGVFERYKLRRRELEESAAGITTPESLAAYLGTLMLKEDPSDSGIVEVASPKGKMGVSRQPF